MGMIYVFNKLKWKPPVAAKLLTPPELELNLAYPDNEIAPMPGKQRSIFDSKFKSFFDSKFNSMSTERMKTIQEAIKWTEARLPGKNKAEMEEVVNTSNKLLKQAFDTWQSEIQKTCDECVQKAYEESVKAMKLKLVKAQIKSIAKIVLIAGLVLAAAALTIAATVVTGGALAPLVIAAIATGASALYKAYKVYDSEWATASNKIKEIEADIKKLQTAVDAYKKTEKSYSGKFDTVKAFKATLLAPVDDIEKHVGQLDKFIFSLQTSLKEQKAKLAEVKAKASNKEVDAAVTQCNASIDKANDQLAAIGEAKSAAAKMKADYSAQKLPDYGKLNAVVAKISSNASTMQGVGSSLKTCFTSLKKLGVAI